MGLPKSPDFHPSKPKSGLPRAPVLPKIAKIENRAEIVESLIHEGPYIPISQKPSATSFPPCFKVFLGGLPVSDYARSRRSRAITAIQQVPQFFLLGIHVPL